MSIINWVFTLLILLTSVFTILGSHFDGGSISYKVVGTNGSNVIVRITQSYTYVYTKIYCNDTYIANQWSLILAPYQDATALLNCTANCSTDGGYTPIPVASRCTDYSVGMAITVGQRTDDVLVGNGSYFVVAYQGSAFRTLNLPNGGGSTLGWSISTVIDLRLRPDGTYNTPPKATMISPIYIPVGIQQTILIPTIDEDNDNVRCRFASGANECGAVCPPSSLPNGTSISDPCTLTITGTTAGDWYAVAIQAEDFANSTTTTPFSSVPVQFLVHVYAQPNCTQRPYLFGANPDGTCTSVQVGVPYTLTLYAENYCSSYGVTILDIATQSFPIVIKTPIVQDNGTQYSVTLTWTPTADEIGSEVFCSVGIDSQSVQTNQYCLTFIVGNGTLEGCPGEEMTTTEEMTTAALTTEAPTTAAPTTEAPTTAAPTTVAPTTAAPVTAAPATAAVTTASPTTTTTVENTTSVNNTSVAKTVIIVYVIIIPICCCCCCWWLFYFIRPCRRNDVEQQKKPVTTYTIEGAYVNKDYSLIDLNDEINEKNSSNNDPLTDTSYITLYDADRSLSTESLRSKSLLSMDNNHNQSLPLTPSNVPLILDTTSDNIDGYKMMMHHDPFPLSSSIRHNVQAVPNPTGNNIYGVPTKISSGRYRPSQFSTRMSTSSAPATIRSNIYQDDIQKPIDPLQFKSLSQSALSSSRHLRLNGDLPESNARPVITPWTKHPRWVLRLSKPKKIHPSQFTSNRSFSREQTNNSLSSSTRSTSTIPRYTFSEK